MEVEVENSGDCPFYKIQAGCDCCFLRRGIEEYCVGIEDDECPLKKHGEILVKIK